MTFTLTRMLDADSATVFRAWTDPDRLRWFFSGREPAGEAVEVDLRVGGVWRQRMVVDADTDYITGGIYRRIEPDTLLEFRWGADGGWPALDEAQPDSGPLVTVTLEPVGEQTRMSLVVDPPGDVPADVCMVGWNETIDRLVDAVAD